jgi:hypothetical protein
MTMLALLPGAWGGHGGPGYHQAHLERTLDASAWLDNTLASSTWSPDRAAVLVGGLMQCFLDILAIIIFLPPVDR